MRRITLSLVFALLMTVTAACGDDADDGAGASGGGAGASSITIAIDPPLFIDPHTSQDHRILDNIFERLLDRDIEDPSKLVPRLASALPESVDDLTWRIELREDVEFTNGEPFNASAAAASIARVIDPALDSDIAGELQTIASAEAVDEFTLEIKTSAPDPILPSRLYLIFMAPEEYSQDPDFPLNPVGTGPYKFVEYVSGEHFDIVRNDDYWGDVPEIESARFQFVDDNQAKVSALKAGEIDLAYGIVPDSADEVPQFITQPSIDNAFLRMKTYEGPFADARVRQAAAYALQSEDYVSQLYSDFVTQAQCQPFGPSVFGFNPDLEPYPYDPDKARELLDEAGYAGEEVRLIAPTDRYPLVTELIEAIAADLTAVGFTVDIGLSLREVWADELFIVIGEGQPDIAFGASSTELNDADKISSWLGAEGALSSDPDPEVDSLLTEARSTLDVDARADLYHDLTKLLCDDAHLISLFRFHDTWGASEELEWTPQIDAGARVSEMHINS